MIHRRSLLASGAFAGLTTLVPLPTFAQPAKKDTVTLALTLEPPMLDPTASAASSISEITQYNIFETLTKINPDGSVSPCWPRAGKSPATSKPTPCACARACNSKTVSPSMRTP